MAEGDGRTGTWSRLQRCDLLCLRAVLKPPIRGVLYLDLGEHRNKLFRAEQPERGAGAEAPCL